MMAALLGCEETATDHTQERHQPGRACSEQTEEQETAELAGHGATGAPLALVAHREQPVIVWLGVSR